MTLEERIVLDRHEWVEGLYRVSCNIMKNLIDKNNIDKFLEQIDEDCIYFYGDSFICVLACKAFMREQNVAMIDDDMSGALADKYSIPTVSLHEIKNKGTVTIIICDVERSNEIQNMLNTNGVGGRVYFIGEVV